MSVLGLQFMQERGVTEHRSPFSQALFWNIFCVCPPYGSSGNPHPIRGKGHRLLRHDKPTWGWSVPRLLWLVSFLCELPNGDSGLCEKCLWYGLPPKLPPSAWFWLVCCRAWFVRFFFTSALVVAGWHTYPTAQLLLGWENIHIQPDFCYQIFDCFAA